MKFTSESGLGDKAELIPQGTLVKAVVTVNAIKQSQATDGRYMQLEFTVSDGIYRNRKIWDLVCDPHDERNSRWFGSLHQSEGRTLVRPCSR